MLLSYMLIMESNIIMSANTIMEKLINNPDDASIISFIKANKAQLTTDVDNWIDRRKQLENKKLSEYNGYTDISDYLLCMLLIFKKDINETIKYLYEQKLITKDNISSLIKYLEKRSNQEWISLNIWIILAWGGHWYILSLAKARLELRDMKANDKEGWHIARYLLENNSFDAFTTQAIPTNIILDSSDNTLCHILALNKQYNKLEEFMNDDLISMRSLSAPNKCKIMPFDYLAENEDSLPFIQFLINKKKFNINNAVLGQSQTIVHGYALMHNVNAVKTCIKEHSFNVFQTNGSGLNIWDLFILGCFKRKLPNFSIVDTLLKEELIENINTIFFKSKVWHSILDDQTIDVVHRNNLLKLAIDKKLCDPYLVRDNLNLYHRLACMDGFSVVYPILKDNGVVPNTQITRGMTLLHLLAQVGKYEEMKIMMNEFQSDPNQLDFLKNDAWTYLAQSGCFQAVREEIAQGNCPEINKKRSQPNIYFNFLQMCDHANAQRKKIANALMIKYRKTHSLLSEQNTNYHKQMLSRILSEQICTQNNIDTIVSGVNQNSFDATKLYAELYAKIDASNEESINNKSDLRKTERSIYTTLIINLINVQFRKDKIDYCFFEVFADQIKLDLLKIILLDNNKEMKEKTFKVSAHSSSITNGSFLSASEKNDLNILFITKLLDNAKHNYNYMVVMGDLLHYFYVDIILKINIAANSKPQDIILPLLEKYIEVYKNDLNGVNIQQSYINHRNSFIEQWQKYISDFDKYFIDENNANSQNIASSSFLLQRTNTINLLKRSESFYKTKQDLNKSSESILTAQVSESDSSSKRCKMQF